jgi:hypothetical protein
MPEILYRSTQGGEQFRLPEILFDSQPKNGGLYRTHLISFT